MMASRKQRGWIVPGFGLPLRWPEMQERAFQPLLPWYNDTLLFSALDATESPYFCYTIRELTMLAWMNELTDLPDWHRKVFNPDLIFEWKSAKILAGHDVTRSMADWCAEEVKYYVRDFTYSRIIPAIDGGIIKTDDGIDTTIKVSLQKAASTLRRGWAGGKYPSEQIVDIVDPYLFPYAWDKTKTLRGGQYVSMNNCISNCGDGEPVKMPREGDCVQDTPWKYRNDMAWSRRFQWLPFDVDFQNKGQGPSRIKSYINNVNPSTQRDLYKLVEHLIDDLIPLFNRSLIDIKAPGYQNQRIHLAEISRDPVVKRDPDSFRPPEQRSYGEYINDRNRYHDFIFVDLKKEFWNTGLQLVLQMQDINLTPENPNYNGEEWHIQGQNNERIVATALYIYSTNNLSTHAPPTLSFRRRVDPEEATLARDSADWSSPPYLSDIYGASDRSPSVQHMGTITLREGRTVVYPNIFQTRLVPFESNDKAKEGHLSILMLHLVDPNRRIMSTSMVPCQRRDWWEADASSKSAMHPVSHKTDEWPISMEEGQRMRSEFRAEREEFRKRNTSAMMGYQKWDFGDQDPTHGDEDEWDLCHVDDS